MAVKVPREPIPHPPGHILVGNLFDLDPDRFVDRLMTLARESGPIYRIDVPGGNSRVVVSGSDLVDEVCDGSRCDEMLGVRRVSGAHDTPRMGGTTRS